MATVLVVPPLAKTLSIGLSQFHVAEARSYGVSSQRYLVAPSRSMSTCGAPLVHLGAVPRCESSALGPVPNALRCFYSNDSFMVLGISQFRLDARGYMLAMFVS